jgi:hypothetical protein
VEARLLSLLRAQLSSINELHIAVYTVPAVGCPDVEDLSVSGIWTLKCSVCPTLGGEKAKVLELSSGCKIRLAFWRNEVAPKYQVWSDWISGSDHPFLCYNALLLINPKLHI